MVKSSLSENRYQEIVESLQDMIYELNDDGGFIYANTALLKASGYTKDELRNMNYWDLVLPEFKYNLAVFYQKQRDQKTKDTYFEFPMITKKKKIIWVSQNVTMSFDKNGQVVSTIAIAHNINETLAIQDQLRRSSKLLLDAQKMANIGHWEVDLSGEVLFWSDITKAIHEVPDDYKPTLEEGISFYTEDSRPIIAKMVDEAIQKGTGWDVSLEIITAKGNHKWVRAIGQTEKLHGKVEKLFGVFQDISDAKNKELALKEAQERAELTARAKDEFLSTMSHEIRTPLNAIIGMSHLLMQETSPGERLENLNILKFSSENLLALVNDILDFAKIESEKVVLEKISFDFYELINNIRNVFSSKVDEKRILLNVIVDTSIPKILIGDPIRLTQILTNLLSNAVKFTEKGRVKLMIYRSDEIEKELKLDFYVEDTGIGIPHDRKQLIFDRFTQAEKETTRKYGGSGLGLAITKKLIELHGEEIHVKSKVGKGSNFTFQLRFEKPKQEKTIKNVTHTKSSTRDLKGTNILVVEDDVINQAVVRKYLSQLNVSVDIADSGQQGIDKTKSNKYDLILMDIHMPEMNGYETTQAIRKLASCKDIPILALTADLDKTVKKKALHAGMNDVLTKPINNVQLERKINMHLSMQVKLSIDTAQHEFINLHRIRKIADGDAIFFMEILNSYKKEIKSLKTKYRKVLIQDDEKAFRDLKHKSKPALEMFEAKSLAEEFAKGQKLIGSDNKRAKETNLKKVDLLCDSIVDTLTKTNFEDM